MAPVKKTLQQYVIHRDRLDARLNELRQKHEVFTSSNTPAAVGSPVVPSQSALATEILIEIIEVKLGFLNETITSLESLKRENPSQTTPIELQLSRFDDWVDTNQQLYELNTRLYDTQKNMLEVRQTQNIVDTQESRDTSLIVQNSVEPDNVLKTFKTASTGHMITYISERLRPRNNRLTFEAMKIDEYVRECTQYQGGTLEAPPTGAQGEPRGAHPRAYHRFVELLCNYITHRHSSSQGQELQAAEVYTAIEHQLIPCIKPYITCYVTEQDKDKKLNSKCLEFEGITLSQLRVPPEYQTKELIPFATAIAYLKGSYFAASPTDKMYSIVKAAKSLHDTVGMGDAGGGIDGDTFLDLWIYVTIKANMKDMATNVKLMLEYGNPQLSIGEAGYYLTTITAAMNYIETLTHDKLGKQIENGSTFLVCEKARAQTLCDIVRSGMELVQEDIELTGYRIAVVRLWALDTSKLFKTVLFHTGDEDDKAMVTMIRLSNDRSSPQTVQYFYDVLTEPQIPWITCTSIMNSMTRVADPTTAIKEQLVVLPPFPADTDESLDTLSYMLQLLRTSSDTVHVHKEEEEKLTKSVSLKKSTQRKFEMSDSFLDVKDHRSRFSLPVRRFLSAKSRKSTNKSSIQTEHHAGKWFTDDDDHWSRPKDILSPTRAQPSPPSIVVTAEIHSAVTNPMSLLSIDNGDEDYVVEKDDGSQSLRGLSPPRFNGGTVNFFSSQFRESLEGNFMHNHHHGINGGREQYTNIKKYLKETVQQSQLVLQRLGYLSPLHRLDGVYDDIMKNAVQLYQVHENERKVPLDGVLSVQTVQFMRQEYVMRFNNLISILKDGTVDSNTVRQFCEFPLSTKQEDCDRFKSVVTMLQQKAGIAQRCRVGTLCDETENCVKKLSKVVFL